MGGAALACVHYQPLYEYGEEIHGFVTEQMMHGAQRMAWWSLLGLLSSSCCALQILLNACSVRPFSRFPRAARGRFSHLRSCVGQFGCAGFNTALGPWRATFVALTLTVQTISWCVAWERPYQWYSFSTFYPQLPFHFLVLYLQDDEIDRPPTAAATLLALVLTLLPEILDFRVARRERLALEAAASSGSDGSSTVTLQLSSLGCAACVEKVSTVLDGMENVISHHVSLAFG